MSQEGQEFVLLTVLAPQRLLEAALPRIERTDDEGRGQKHQEPQGVFPASSREVESGRNKFNARAARPVASRPGPRPPYQALIMTAASNGEATPEVPGGNRTAMGKIIATATTGTR